NIMFSAPYGLCGDLLSQSNDRGMQAKLKDRVDLASCCRLRLREAVDVPRVKYQRLFTDGVGTRSQREPDVRIMQVIGRADRHEFHPLAVMRAAQLIDVAVKTLKLSEESALGEVAVYDADRIRRIQRGNEATSRGLNGAHVSRSYKSTCANQGKITHDIQSVK